MVFKTLTYGHKARETNKRQRELNWCKHFFIAKGMTNGRRSQNRDIYQLFIWQRTNKQMTQRIQTTQQQKTRNPIKKWAHNRNRNVFQRRNMNYQQIQWYRLHVINHHGSASWHHLTSAIVIVIKPRIAKVIKNVKKMHCWWEFRLIQSLWKALLAAPYKIQD